MHKKDIWVGKLLLVTCSIFQTTIFAIFQNKHTHFKTFPNKHLHFQTSYKIENIFKRSNIFVYILTNKNHYKDFQNDGLSSKYFQNHSKHHFKQFQKQSRWSKQVTKSPWKTMDEKGANTFPFYDLPPNSRNNLKGLSCSFQPFLFDKRKVGGDSC